MAIIKTTDKDKLDFDAAISELSEYFSSLGARKGRTLTYNVLTYGCQLNESDSEKLTGMLTSMGLKESSGGELDAADVIVFNTCSVRENADRHLFGDHGRARQDQAGDSRGAGAALRAGARKRRKAKKHVSHAF